MSRTTPPRVADAFKVRKGIELVLPYPPSINHYWRHTRAGRHYISEEGVSFRKTVGEAVLEQARGATFGDHRLKVKIVAHPPDKRARDLDNIQKALLDALQHAGLYVSDSQIDELAIMRGSPGGFVEVNLCLW